LDFEPFDCFDVLDEPFAPLWSLLDELFDFFEDLVAPFELLPLLLFDARVVELWDAFDFLLDLEFILLLFDAFADRDSDPLALFDCLVVCDDADLAAVATCSLSDSLEPFPSFELFPRILLRPDLDRAAALLLDCELPLLLPPLLDLLL
jgi:hypothetical protein